VKICNAFQAVNSNEKYEYTALKVTTFRDVSLMQTTKNTSQNISCFCMNF